MVLRGTDLIACAILRNCLPACAERKQKEAEGARAKLGGKSGAMQAQHEEL